MFIASILRPRTVVAVALALIMGSVAYGFAAANTIPDTNAGDGTSTISGYTVTNVTYMLEVADPSMLDTVVFTLTPDDGGATAGTVKAQLITGGTWYNAANGGSGDVWTIDPAAGSLTTSTVNTLRVVAHD